MNKEIEDKLDDLIEEIAKSVFNEKEERKILEQALKENAEIKVVNKNGCTQVSMEGRRLTLLLLLAGLEKNILKKTNTPEIFFEQLKKIVGTKED